MEDWAPRHVEKKESERLGIEQGWYGTKVSGTFVTGRTASRQECLVAISKVTGIPLKPVRD
jgi:hypothetical protein